MAKLKWYSPQLSRELVSPLYRKAKAESVPMTLLAHRLMEKALGKDKQLDTQRVVVNRKLTEPN